MTEAVPPAAPLDVDRALVRSSAWMVGLRWTLRGIGVVNTFILARLLMPEDFGLVAMATLMIGLVEIFGQTGQILALIRHPNPTREHFDSVWTVTILIGAAITVLLWAISPLAAMYFHEPRAVGVVQVLAIRAFIGGFENIGVVAFRKDLQFSKEFRYQVAQRVINFFATIAIALWLRNYWALVAGMLGGRIIAVGVSYVVHSYRPRFCLTKVREIWSFSAWMLVVHVAQFLQDKADEFVVGNLTNAGTMGDYNVAADAATAPTVELVLPTTRALFPIFSKLADEPAALTEAYLKVFATIAILVCSTATGVTLVAHDFVAVTLGWKWMSAVPLVEWLAMSGAFYSIMQGAITLISATGHGKLSATLAISRTVLTFPAMVIAGLLGTVETVAATRTVLTFLFIPGVFFALARVLPLRVSDLLNRLWRPMLAAAVMTLVVKLCHPWLPDIPVVRLLLDAGIGAAAFISVLLYLWRMAGRPAGPEQAVVDAVRRKLSRSSVSMPQAETGGGPTILVVSAFAANTEWTVVKRGPIGRLRNRIRRTIDRLSWTMNGHWTFHYSSYNHYRDSNRGDSAIRRASIELLRGIYPGSAKIMEFGWDDVGQEFIDLARQGADLVVVAGGGYFFCDANGDLPARVRAHLAAFEQIDCPVVGLGLGMNRLLPQEGVSAPLSAETRQILAKFLGRLSLCSVRDKGTMEAFACVVETPPIVVPDPALLLLPRPVAGLPQRTDGDGVWIGVNLAFHGPLATRLLANLFPVMVAALRSIQEQQHCRFLYFVHSASERLLPRLLARAGIHTLVVDCCPEEMLSWYGLLDVHVCEMLHSAILAANANVPALNLAYDEKNLAFYELMGLTEVLPVSTVTADQIIHHLNALLAEVELRRAALRQRKSELGLDMDRFLTMVAAVVEPTAAGQVRLCLDGEDVSASV